MPGESLDSMHAARSRGLSLRFLCRPCCRALAMFRKVVELKPDHEEVHALLAAVSPPEPAPEAGSGGLISRFFKKA